MIQLALLLTCLWQPPAEFPAGTVARDQLPQSRALDYEFDDVRIATILGWLRRVGVEPPVPVAGRVSGWLWAQAPTSGWWRVADYRVEGELTSPLLDVDRFSIRSARVRFGYRQGLWTIGTVSGQMESRLAGQDPVVLGQANLAAQLPMAADETASASGRIEQVSLSSLLAILGIEGNVPTGIAQATFRLTTPLRTLSDPLAWQAEGTVAGRDVAIGKIAGLQLSSPWQLRDRQFSLPAARVVLDQQTLQVAGVLQLEQQFAWSLTLPPQAVRLTENLFRRLAVEPTTVRLLPLGSVDLALQAQGALAPWQAAYSLELARGQLNWQGNALGNLSTSVRLVAGGLMLDRLTANLAGGAIDGQAAFTTNLDEPVTFNLNYQGIDLSRLNLPTSNSNPDEPGYVLRGVVSGQARLTAAKNKLDDLQALAINLSGQGAGVRINDWGLGNIEYSLQKDSGSNDMAIDLKDAGASKRWQAVGQLHPEAKRWSYNIDAQGNELDLSIPQLIKLLGVEPTLPVALEILLVTGNIKFSGDTQDGLKATQFNLSNVTTLERNRVVWAQGSLIGFTDPRMIQVDQSKFSVGGSQIKAAVTWHRFPRPVDLQPPADDQPDRLKLSIDELTLETLQSWNVLPLPAARGSGRVPRGQIDLTIDVQRPAVEGQPVVANWRGDVSAHLSELTLGRHELGELTLAGNLTPNQWQAKAEGSLLNADLQSDVTVAFGSEPQWRIERFLGTFNWLGAEVGQLTSLWQSDAESSQWRGLANVRGQFDWQLGDIVENTLEHTATDARSGSFEVEVPQLAYRGRSLVRDLRAQLVLDDQQLRIVRLAGCIGGGRAEVSGAYDLQSSRIEGLALNLSRIDLSEAAQLIDPDLAEDWQGRADMRARVRVNRGLDLQGDLRLHDAVLYGVPIAQAHSDVEVITSADQGVTRVFARNVRGRAFGGRLDADLEARLSTSRTIQLRARIARGEVEQLSEWTGTSSVVGRGKFDANLDLNSPRFRTSRDLRGRLDLNFEDTDAQTLPISDQLARFVPLFGLGSTEFERGRLSATISGGALRMRTLALWGRQLSVLGSGDIGLASGQLDVQLVVRVGGGLSQQIAANYLTQLAASAVPPVELVLQINRLVANRAIFLRIAGTASQPIIQPQTGRIIEQALLRSLLEQAVGIPAVVGTVRTTTVAD